MSELAKLRIRERGTIVLATLEGEVDVSNRDHVAKKLTEAVANSATGLLLDLSGLEFMDSSGVHLLYTLAERLSARQQRYAVVLPPSSPPRRAIELSGTAPAGWLHADSDSALRALGNGA
jgi:anti-anti-sigma factor